MSKRDEKGFSLIELLIVVVVIGIIAAVAIPAVKKALVAGEIGNAYATMHTIGTVQTSFYSQNGRYGRLNEINNLHGGSLGTASGTDLLRGKFVIAMTPATPTNDELKSGFTITATRNIPSEGQIYVYEVTPSGLNPVFP
jgi:prepilin-type N-terminal cleavage/methylation domain-containing protein